MKCKNCKSKLEYQVVTKEGRLWVCLNCGFINRNSLSIGGGLRPNFVSIDKGLLEPAQVMSVDLSKEEILILLHCMNIVSEELGWSSLERGLFNRLENYLKG